MTAAQQRARAYRQRVRAVIRDKRISSGARFLWVLIESYADATGWNCFPSVPTLAKDADHNEAWVKEKLRELKAHGFVEIGKRKTAAGWVNEYSLIVPEEAPKQGEGTVENLP